MSSLVYPSQLRVPVEQDEDGREATDDCSSQHKGCDKLRSASDGGSKSNATKCGQETHVEVVVSLFVADMTSGYDESYSGGRCVSQQSRRLTSLISSCHADKRDPLR